MSLKRVILVKKIQLFRNMIELMIIGLFMLIFLHVIEVIGFRLLLLIAALLVVLLMVLVVYRKRLIRRRDQFYQE